MLLACPCAHPAGLVKLWRLDGAGNWTYKPLRLPAEMASGAVSCQSGRLG